MGKERKNGKKLFARMKPTSIRSRPTVFEIKEESIKEKSKEPRMKIVEELEKKEHSGENERTRKVEMKAREKK